jgi:peptidoglycan/xylan/chitin deacetylase (PgdA/CDA1 family)
MNTAPQVGVRLLQRIDCVMSAFNKIALPFAAILLVFYTPLLCVAQTAPIEIHNKIHTNDALRNRVALTLDACSGAYDHELIDFLILKKIPTTIFVTKKWIDANAHGMAVLKRHLDLFDIEDHGENHIPAVIGAGRRVYGILGEPDLLHLRREVLEGARAIEKKTGVSPRWYRGATAAYDPQAIAEIRRMGFKLAGFSINVDAGATLRRAQIIARMRNVKAGDVLIAHMNKPKGDSAEGLIVGLADLQRRGFIFVRLDQVELDEVTNK